MYKFLKCLDKSTDVGCHDDDDLIEEKRKNLVIEDSNEMIDVKPRDLLSHVSDEAFKRAKTVHQTEIIALAISSMIVEIDEGLEQDFGGVRN